MNHRTQGDKTANDLGELREQAEHTRDELGRTVEALAAKADVKAQAGEKVAEVREKAAVATERAKEKAVVAADLVKEKTAVVTDRAREKATQAADLVQEKTPDPVLERAEVVAHKAKANRTPLVAGAAAVAGFLLVRRIIRGRRGRR
ncbi:MULTISPECIES: DUF3618 domain-containing protein [unclassified Streptomyces]|uniref:DUF3618 domain-containing protein n=1 Tax=unclassified Streptomyces TaxID=2593676 RepID=UPI003D756D0F